MKRLLKMILCLNFLLMMFGCSQEESPKSDLPSQDIKEPEIKQNDSQYITGWGEKIDFEAAPYRMILPDNAKGYNYSYCNNFFTFMTKDNVEIRVFVSTSVLLNDSEKALKLEDLNGEFQSQKDLNLYVVFPNDGDVKFSDQFVKTTTNGREALLDKGVAKDSSGDLFNYALYQFFFDEESICQFLVGSQDMASITPDELAKIADELIATIEPM